MNKTLSHRARHALSGTIIGAVVAAIVVALFLTGIVRSLENKSYDLRLALTRTSAKAAGKSVALLYVDEGSLATMKQMGISWPWPRELYASALDFCKRGGAKAVLFDLFYSEDSTYGVADDEGFAAGVRSGPPSYFVLFGSAQERETDARAGEVLAKSQVPVQGVLPSFVPEVRSLASLPIPPLIETATGFGNAQVAPDNDGIYRRVPPLLRLGDGALPQIALKLVADLTGVRSMQIDDAWKMTIDDRVLPLDGQGNLLISYIGGVDSYPVYPLGQVLLSAQQLAEGKTPDLDPAVLKDRVVIVGVAAPGLYDLKPTPLSRVSPGPEIHATLIDSLLRHDFLTPVGNVTTILVIFAMALLASLVLSQLARLSQIALFLFGTSAVFLAAVFLLFKQGIVIPVVAPLLALIASSFGMILKNYLTEGRRRQAIKRAFGQYLSPAVVSEIARDPDNVRMGGDEQEVTVFFSDIADFTTISEKMSPTELVEKLCQYLSAVTGVIIERQGTLDKYIGDAVMAFWGAPLRCEDHAAKGVLSALEVQELLKEFPQFITRIGLNTGRCVVGNIGSDLRFNYTAMGDTVNLASRLEGLNKQFGTRIILAESTYRQAQEVVEARLIGRVRVKGRLEPISIYEPLAKKGGLTAEAMAYYGEFDTALQRFFAADFAGAHAAFAQLSAKRPGDSVVASYVTLCHTFATTPPPAPFDGVIVFKEK